MVDLTATADGQQHVHEVLSSFIDGDLSESDMRAVERHLASCASCQADYRTLLLTVRALRSLPSQPVPRAFTIPAEEAAPRRANAIRWLRLSTGALAAAFVAVLALRLLLPTATEPGISRPAAVPTAAPAAAPAAPAPGIMPQSALAPAAAPQAPPAAAPTSTPYAPASASGASANSTSGLAPSAPTPGQPGTLQGAARVAASGPNSSGTPPPTPTAPTARTPGGAAAPAAALQAAPTPTEQAYPVSQTHPASPVLVTPASYPQPATGKVVTPAQVVTLPTRVPPAAVPANPAPQAPAPTPAAPQTRAASGPVWFTPGLGVLAVLALLSAAALTWLSRRRS
jgi:hypothetical protein